MAVTVSVRSPKHGGIGNGLQETLVRQVVVKLVIPASPFNDVLFAQAYVTTSPTACDEPAVSGGILVTVALTGAGKSGHVKAEIKE